MEKQSLKWLEIVKVVGPLVLELIPALAEVLHPIIVKGIVDAEKSNSTGDEKLEDVLALPELEGHERSAIVEGVEAIIAIANALKK
jgi:hypothetical protein